MCATRRKSGSSVDRRSLFSALPYAFFFFTALSNLALAARDERASEQTNEQTSRRAFWAREQIRRYDDEVRAAVATRWRILTRKQFQFIFANHCAFSAYVCKMFSAAKSKVGNRRARMQNKQRTAAAFVGLSRRSFLIMSRARSLAHTRRCRRARDRCTFFCLLPPPHAPPPPPPSANHHVARDRRILCAAAAATDATND